MTSKFIWQIGEDWSITDVTKGNNKLFANAKATPVYAVLGNSQMLETDTVEMTCEIKGEEYHKNLLFYPASSGKIIVDDEAVSGWQIVSNGEELAFEIENYETIKISFNVKRFSTIDGTTLLKNQTTSETTENVYAGNSYTPMVEPTDAERIEHLIDELNAIKQDKYDLGLETEAKYVTNAINEVNALKQNKYDDLLETTNKTVVGAINELNDEIEGASGDVDAKIQEHNQDTQAHPHLQDLIDGKQDILIFDNVPTANSNNPVTSSGIKNYVDDKINLTNKAFAVRNYQLMVAYFNALPYPTHYELSVGQSVFIIALDVPDLWISSIETTSVPYTYVDDATFIADLKQNGYVQVGYYRLSELETEKVDLTNYATKTYVDNGLNEKQDTINSNNKLNADLVDDTNTTNKFVTTSEKSTWNGKQDKLTAGANITIDNNNVITTKEARSNIAGGVYMFEDADSFQIWNINPQEVHYTETDGVYEINTLNYTENNGIYEIGDNE